MIRTVVLHGKLRELTNVESIQLDVNSPRELTTALISQVSKFRAAMMAYPNMCVVMCNEDKSNITSLTPETFDFNLSNNAEQIHIIPKMEGAGFDPITIALAISSTLGTSIATAIVIYNVAINFAMSFVLGLVSKMLAPSPNTSAGSARPDERPSFLYNGAINVIEQGYAIPVICGTHMVGSTVVSAGVDIAEIAYDSGQAVNPANGGGDTQPAAPPAETYQFDGNWGNN